MAHADNYAIQAAQAKARFLTYDQETLIRKLRLSADETHLFLPVLGQLYRIHRLTGDMERQTGSAWVDANTHGEVLTLLDLLCDSRPDRFVCGRWKNMAAFGLLFHQTLLEGTRDPWADRFEAQPDRFRRACEALGGIPFPTGDAAYILELFDGLPVVIQLWFGDEEFPASLRFLWDENTLLYIKYETMYYAKGLLLQRLRERMES